MSKFSLKFPIEIDENGNAVTNDIYSAIDESLTTILDWPLRHRLFMGQFGSRLYELLEEPNDNITSVLLRHFTLEAIKNWEDRIKINDLIIKFKEQGLISLKIVYTIKNINQDGVFNYEFKRY